MAGRLAQRDRAIEARRAPGMAHALCVLLDLDEERVLVAVDPNLEYAQRMAGGLALLP